MSALDDIRQRAERVWLCPEDCPSPECRTEQDRARLLGALDAIEDQLRWFDAAIANNPDVKVSARVAARRIRTAVNDALEGK